MKTLPINFEFRWIVSTFWGINCNALKRIRYILSKSTYLQISSLNVLSALIYEDVWVNKVSLKNLKMRNSFLFFVLSFKFSRTLPRKAMPQVSCLVWNYFQIHLCCFRFIWLLGDTTSNINAIGSSIQPRIKRENFWIYYRNGQTLFCYREKCSS